MSATQTFRFGVCAEARNARGHQSTVVCVGNRQQKGAAADVLHGECGGGGQAGATLGHLCLLMVGDESKPMKSKRKGRAMPGTFCCGPTCLNSSAPKAPLLCTSYCRQGRVQSWTCGSAMAWGARCTGRGATSEYRCFDSPCCDCCDFKRLRRAAWLTFLNKSFASFLSASLRLSAEVLAVAGAPTVA